jgi:alanine-synthesizing transaminase
MLPRLSKRTAWSTETTPLHRAIERARSGPSPPLDLTITNPTRVGLTHPDELYARLFDTQLRYYDPCAIGLRSARRAIATYYEHRGLAVDPDRMWLTAGTSEAYAQLCAVLCDPGQAIADRKSVV